MKRLCALILFLSGGVLQAESSGQLVLEGEYLVFRSGDTEIKYQLNDVPGLKLLEYTPKRMVKDGKELDASEAGLLLDPARKIVLTAFKPVPVVKTVDNGVTTWKVAGH